MNLRIPNPGAFKEVVHDRSVTLLQRKRNNISEGAEEGLGSVEACNTCGRFAPR